MNFDGKSENESENEIPKSQLLYEKMQDEMSETRSKLRFYIIQNDKLLTENKRLKHLMYIYELVIKKICDKKNYEEDE